MGIMIAVIAIAAAQAATDPAPASSERRLTPEQIEAVLAEAAAKRKAAEEHVPVEPVIADLDPIPQPQIHGEFGFGVGTGGYREVFGTGIYPMGNDGAAIISLDFIDWGKRRFQR